MKKVLLLDTSIATFNLGDEIINDSIRLNWPDLFAENYIVRYPAHTPPYSWWQQLFFKKKFSNLSNVDYRFLCGTNALYTNMLRPLPVWNVQCWNSRFLNGTVLLGVGAGVNSNSINYYTKKLYNGILSKEYIHSVRDEYTKDMLVKLGYRVINTGCPTIWGLTPELCKQVPTQKSKNVVFTLTGKQPDEENDRLMIDILVDNYEKLYFWPQTITDIDYLNYLGKYKYTMISPNLHSYDSILNTDIDYVGSRLHGGIRALQHKKRTMIISIDYRADNMAKNYSLPVMPRAEINNQLRNFINSSCATEITGIDWMGIQVWKSQFDFV